MLTAAGLLLVLVAGITWLVTRQVVTPVRMARRVAERLAAGQLQERLRVSGEDDLARLATSFNQMATNLQRQIRQLEELSRVQRRFVSDVSHELRTPADHRADGRRRAARRARRLRPDDRAGRRAAADRARPVRDAAGRPARDQPLRRRRRGARGRRRQPRRRRAPGRRRHPRRWPSSAAAGSMVEAPDHPCLAEADVRRVERIVRNLVTNAIDHAESGATSTIRVAGDEQAAAIAVRDYGVGLAAGGVGDGLQPVLARRPGPGPHQRRHRPGAVDLARGHPPARRLAAGVGAARRGRPVPAHAAAPGRRRAAAQPAAAGARRTPREPVR